MSLFREDLILDQYGGSANLIGYIKALCAGGELVAEGVEQLGYAYDVYAAEGEWLDLLASLKGLSRNDGETDEELRARILAVHTDAGTPDGVIRVCTELSGDEEPFYMDEAPATYFVYTPGGTQLTLGQHSGISPAGVLGLPGAAFRIGSGSLLGSCDGDEDLVLAVADEIAESTAIETESEIDMETEDGEYLETEEAE